MADFVKVYISEAHPIDEWKVYSDIDYCQPVNLEERISAAQQYLREQLPHYLEASDVDVAPPFCIDKMDNAAEFAYSAHPERIYMIDGGFDSPRVVYKGDMGPFGYKPEELRHWFEVLKSGLVENGKPSHLRNESLIERCKAAIDEFRLANPGVKHEEIVSEPK